MARRDDDLPEGTLFEEERDENGNWVYTLQPCDVCRTETRLRCSPCRGVICHICACPNGCDREGPEVIARPEPAVEESSPEGVAMLERLRDVVQRALELFPPR